MEMKLRVVEGIFVLNGVHGAALKYTRKVVGMAAEGNLKAIQLDA